MRVDVKFCGLTRAEDAEFAAELGAAYVGVIFAGGPRQVDRARARAVRSAVPRSTRRVGVFGDQPAASIAELAGDLELDVVQLHGELDSNRMAALRRQFDGAVWPVVRVADGVLPDGAQRAAASGDVLFLDAYAAGALGGTGVELPWERMAAAVAAARAREGGRPLVLAGGLKPENVGRAIGALSPSVVDVSSGVERAPGVKDHARMRAFRDAVREAMIAL